MQEPAIRAVEHPEHFVQFYEEDPPIDVEKLRKLLETGDSSARPRSAA